MLFLGGGCGALVRYFCSQGLQTRFLWAAPWSIAGVNLSGSFLIGMTMMWALQGGLTGNLRLFLVTGFLGGFTTFSTFALDLFQYLRDGDIRSFLLLALVSNVGAILAAASGFGVARLFFR